MKVFGVVNASPDSLAEFSVATTYGQAMQRGRDLLADGADFFDLGGQASHRDAAMVDVDTEWSILREPLAALLTFGVEVSVDTWQVETARRAFDAGATVLNAADALQNDEMAELVAEREATAVLPFMLGPDPRHLSHVEGDPVGTMVDWFAVQLSRAERWGIRDRLLLDPGTGFAPAHWDWSERCEYQRIIYANLDQLRRFDLPIYVPVAWKLTADRIELIDIVMAHKPEYVRAHRPGHILDRYASVNGQT